MASIIQILTAVGTGGVIPINLRRFQFGVGLLVTLQPNSTATYTVQVTGDDVSQFFNPAVPIGLANSLNWNSHDTLVGKIASANGNLAYPCTAVRLLVSALVGTIAFAVVQAEGSS